jgi:outer membrane protein TolC
MGGNMIKALLFIFTSFLIYAAESDDLILLGSLKLKDAERVAITNNKNYLISNQNVKQANYRKKQALSRWFPKIQYDAYYLASKKPQLALDYFSFFETLKKNIFYSRFEMKQPIFSTNLYYKLKTKKLELKESKYEKNTFYNELLLKVRSDYYAIVLFQNSLAVQKENISYLTEALKLEKKQLDAGSSTTYQVNQSKVAVANAITQYYSTLKNYQNAKNSLVDSLGIEPFFEKILQIEETQMPIFLISLIKEKLNLIQEGFLYQYDNFFSTEDMLTKIEQLDQEKKLILFTEKELESYITLAINKRPDLKQQKTGIQIAQQQINQKKGKYLPEISGYIDYAYNAAQPGDKSFFKQPYSIQGGVRLTWTIFDSLLRENKIQEAKAYKTSKCLEYEYVYNTIELDLRNILYRLEETLFAYLSASEAVLLAEQAMQQAKDKLKFGKIPPLDYRETANSLAQAKNHLNQASYSLLINYYQLRYATGEDIKYKI